jgi:hypothetical protein
MIATATPVYGYTEQGATPHYLRLGRERTACKRAVKYVPTVQPVFPAAVCQSCARAVAKGAEFVTADDTTPEAEGVCPVCEETHLLNDLGMLIAHTVERTKSGHVRCDGSGHGAEVAE